MYRPSPPLLPLRTHTPPVRGIALRLGGASTVVLLVLWQCALWQLWMEPVTLTTTPYHPIALTRTNARPSSPPLPLSVSLSLSHSLSPHPQHAHPPTTVICIGNIVRRPTPPTPHPPYRSTYNLPIVPSALTWLQAGRVVVPTRISRLGKPCPHLPENRRVPQPRSPHTPADSLLAAGPVATSSQPQARCVSHPVTLATSELINRSSDLHPPAPRLTTRFYHRQLHRSHFLAWQARRGHRRRNGRHHSQASASMASRQLPIWRTVGQVAKAA